MPFKFSIPNIISKLNILRNNQLDIRTQVNNIQKEFTITSYMLARIKLREILYMIPWLMYKYIYPDANNKYYTIQFLKENLLDEDKEKYYNMLNNLKLTDNYIQTKIKYIMKAYRLKDTYIGEVDLDIDIIDMDINDINKLLLDTDIYQSDIEDCKLLIQAYLYLRLNH